MVTEKDYCDYDTSRLLKELGFICGMGEYSCCIYDDSWHDQVDRPLLYEAQKWLREKKNLHITIFSSSQESWMYRITKQYQKLEDGFYEEDLPTYEDALLQAIKKCIKICK